MNNQGITQITQSIQLLPQQAQSLNAILHSETKHLWYVGGFGSGKSLIGSKLVETVAMKYPGIRIAMLRNSLTNFKNTSLKTFLEVVDNRLFVHNKSENTIRFINGSEAVYFGLDDDEAIGRLKSFEAGFLWIDEIDGVSEEIYRIARNRLRQRKKDPNPKVPEYPRKSFVTSNSGGKNWTWKLFVDEDVDLTVNHGILLKNAKIGDVEYTEQYEWVRADSDSNPHLPLDYLISLHSLEETSKDEYLRYVKADFNVFEGQIYTEWKDHEVIIKPFAIPEHWERRAVIDHGLRNPTAICYFAIDEDGVAYQYDEHYVAGRTPEFHAQNIKEHGFNNVLGDPSMMNKTQVKKGTDIVFSIADEYSENGVSIEPAQNNHIAGRSKVKEMLRQKRIKVFDTCVHTIRCIPSLKWKKPSTRMGIEIFEEDEAPGQEDHIPDVWRYFAMDRVSPTRRSLSIEQIQEREIAMKNPLIGQWRKYCYEKEMEQEEQRAQLSPGQMTMDEAW